jgi:hypothetical protein
VQRWLRAAFGAYERLAYVVVAAASLTVPLWWVRGGKLPGDGNLVNAGPIVRRGPDPWTVE